MKINCFFDMMMVTCLFFKNISQLTRALDLVLFYLNIKSAFPLVNDNEIFSSAIQIRLIFQYLGSSPVQCSVSIIILYLQICFFRSVLS